VTGRTEIVGRLVLVDRIAPGRLVIEDGVLATVDVEDISPAADDLSPLLAPGFVDLHVHGFGGHDAMGGRAALDGMARALARRGVTSFLPTAVTAPIPALVRFAETVRRWRRNAPADGADPLGFNLEGPFLAEARRGAHDRASLRTPASLAPGELDPLVDGLRVITIAPELAGALEIIQALAARGVVVSLGHSAATIEEGHAGYAAGARSTTHLFNAMTGLDHRSPGLALAALLDDDVAVELIVDGHHVSPQLWPLITRLKPRSKVLLVSDALALAGTDRPRGLVGSLEVEVIDGRATLVGTQTLAGSVIALDIAVRSFHLAGRGITESVAAASTNALDLLGVIDRGRLAVGQRADLVELSDDLRVRRVMRGGAWLPPA